VKKLPIFLGALVVVIAVIVISFMPGNVYSANVGDVLTSPESGWTRYETTSNESYYSYFTYSGTWTETGPNSCWSDLYTQYGDSDQNATLSFRFNGTGVRVIAAYYTNRSDHMHITIDGNDYDFSEYTSGSDQYQLLCFHISTLSSGEHQAVISNHTTGATVFEVDAIDIYGSLVDPSSPTPSPTPATTPSPTPTTDLCYDYTIVGAVGTYYPGTISSGSRCTQINTVTGAVLGDFVQVSFNQDLQGIDLFGYVSAANQVTVVFHNGTGSNITLLSGTVRVRVTRHVR
jgi:hypothetical protein